MKKSFLITSFIILLSCSERDAFSIDPLDYIKDTTTISIDRKTETYTRTLQYFSGDLYWWNSDRESITVFDLAKSQIKRTIKMDREGPNGLGFPLGFFINSSDIIYVPTASHELISINSKGEILETSNFNSFSKLGAMVGSITRYSNMAQSDKSGSLYFILSDLENVNPPDLNEKALQEYPLILKFNRSTNSFEFLDFRVPKSLLRFKDSMAFGISSNLKSLLLLHQQSNTLYEVDFDSQKFREFELKSNLIKNFSNEYYNSPRMSNSIEENMNVAFKSSENLGLVFDNNKKLLYRFGWPGEEISNDKDAMKFGYTPRYFTISIYDGSDFSLIKEFTLPRNTYLAHHYFVDEKGLNLFPMHPDNPEFNEDEMVIHTFDFSGLK